MSWPPTTIAVISFQHLNAAHPNKKRVRRSRCNLTFTLTLLAVAVAITYFGLRA